MIFASQVPPLAHLLTLESSQRLISYVYTREHRDGGFTITPLSPPTISDTFYAVRILELLGQVDGLESTKEYIARIDGGISPRAKVRYHLAYLRRRFGLSPRNSSPPSSGWAEDLEDAFFWQKIRHLEGHNFFWSGKAGDRVFYPPELPRAYTMKDLYYYLDLQPHLPPEKITTWLNWVQACQAPDGGFGFRPGTTSFMDNVLPAVKILTKFRRFPIRLPHLVQFIQGCQTKSGGFARKGGGVAFLESSYQAVMVLRLLSALPEEVLSGVN